MKQLSCIILMLLGLIYYSCGLIFNQTKNNKIDQDGYELAMSTFIDKYDFPMAHIDTLKKIKPFIMKNELPKVDSFITQSLFYFMINDRDLTITEEDYNLWYYVPEHTVAIYKDFFGRKKAIEIDNGIKIK